MSEFDRGDGRTHIKSPLMRESLVDKKVIARTHSDREFDAAGDLMKREDLGESAKRKLLAENAARFYDL